MDFNSALSAMRGGFAVRRSFWAPGTCVRHVQETEHLAAHFKRFTSPEDTEGMVWTPDTPEILGLDYLLV